MRGKLQCLVLLLATAVASSQPTSEQINTASSCSYAGDPSPLRVIAFASDSEAEDVVRRIVEAAGIAPNFKIRAAGVSNAAAATQGSQRYLLYNQTFIRDMQEATGSPWAAISVMAHEIGHHLNNHPLEQSREIKYEIEADYYSGFILQKLGASLNEAQIAINYLPMNRDSKTHPPKHDRLAAIANGWTKSCSDTGCNRPSSPTATTAPTRSTPLPKPKETGPNSCDYANDGTCDEPRVCPRGTDTSDCNKPANGPNSCEYANDGNCDEPDLCDRGTDGADCRAARRRSSQLYCCDGWGRQWCSIVVNPGPPGAPCWCAGVPGNGFICE